MRAGAGRWGARGRGAVLTHTSYAGWGRCACNLSLERHGRTQYPARQWRGTSHIFPQATDPKGRGGPTELNPVSPIDLLQWVDHSPALQAALLFLLPFVHEDVAIAVGTLLLQDSAVSTAVVVPSLFSGMVASDVAFYGLGLFATQLPWTQPADGKARRADGGRACWRSASWRPCWWCGWCPAC